MRQNPVQRDSPFDCKALQGVLATKRPDVASTRPTSEHSEAARAPTDKALLPWANHEEQPALDTAAAASAEVVRLGYFGEAQPFQVACARGWFDFSDVEVACLPQASGGYVVSKLDEGDLEVALLGSTPAAFAVARGVDITNFYVAHEKGSPQGLTAARIQSPPDLDGRTFGTPFGSTAHYHMMYIQTLFPDVRFDIIDLNGLNPRDLYDAGTIDGAFVWGGWIDGLVQRNATMLFPREAVRESNFTAPSWPAAMAGRRRRGSTATKREREREMAPSTRSEI